MRIIALIFFAAVILVSCKSSDKPAALTSVQWLDSLVDFGTIQEGQNVEVKFRFKNTGDKPLVVYSVVPGCGCTNPDYPKEPIMPGAESFVKAVFHSEGQPPTVHKTISVAMNTKEQSYTRAFIGEITK